MTDDQEFRRAIETIKLRAPIEDVVRERVAGLKRSGQRLWACCPFHEEDTPSFSVEPSQGFWYCFGACSSGGDQISFLQRLDNLTFLEALEILAARTGVELPRSKRDEPGRPSDGVFDVLQRADSFFQERLHTREGRGAREYLAGRGVGDAAIRAFGLGYAPADGQALVRLAREARLGLEALRKAGLVRVRDDGRPYDFFRGRLVIPIRDFKGRTVGFGARRLDDGDPSAPKYVNTPETDYFHKGRVIYALDRAIDEVRRSRHMILVEGYTDVIAAHQAGLGNVCAVLGTATTEDHAGLVRLAGTRRATLVFDGDEAGRQAAYRALEGLLPLGIELEIAALPEGHDPADLLAEGSEPFVAQLELAQDWFEFVARGLGALRGVELAREVDRVLELIERVSKPVHRESLLAELARKLEMPLGVLRDQRRQLARPRAARPPTRARAAAAAPDEVRRAAPPDPGLVRAYRGLVGAVLVDASLWPLVRPFADACPDADLAVILGAIGQLYEDEDATIDASAVVVALGDHPGREVVPGLLDYARKADDPKNLLDGELVYLQRRELEREKRALLAQIREGGGDVGPLLFQLDQVSKGHPTALAD